MDLVSSTSDDCDLQAVEQTKKNVENRELKTTKRVTKSVPLVVFIKKRPLAHINHSRYHSLDTRPDPLTQSSNHGPYQADRPQVHRRQGSSQAGTFGGDRPDGSGGSGRGIATGEFGRGTLICALSEVMCSNHVN